MQKTRPRRTGKKKASREGTENSPTTTGTPGASAPAGGEVGRGRATHVRNRLIVAVAVVAAAVAGAGTPSILSAVGRLDESKDLVALTEQTQDALTLAHALADERDEVTPYIAAGRPETRAPSEQRGARVDREIEDLRADAEVPAALRADLDEIATVRRAALSGKSTALEAHEAYSRAIAELHRLAGDLAERMPPRAGAGAHALAELDSAVQQAAAARGLLLAALAVPSTSTPAYDPVTGTTTTISVTSEADAAKRDALTAAAQQAQVRSDAALTEFRATAPDRTAAAFDSTVTGPESEAAGKYLESLTDQPVMNDKDLATDPEKLAAALSARLDLMRGAESSLYEGRVKDLVELRDNDVTELEIRIAALVALLLVAVGIATALARSLTRPLAVLRLGSARLAQNPEGEEPIRFTGRKDEFAQVVRSVNTLHGHALALQERLTTLEADRKHLIGERQRMADAREELRAELKSARDQLDRSQNSVEGAYVSLALRILGLVERQLTVIEGLEAREEDPEGLSTLFKVDHFATVMRRHSENLLVLAGVEHGQQHAGPVPLVDVVRAAVSEIERYERVRIGALPPAAHLAGFVADDLSHLLAELLENATAFSPPELPVEVSGWLLESGEVMLSVQDEGIGVTADRLERLNTRLAEFDPEEPHGPEGEEGLGLGLYVVARLAHRHGVRVRLREQKQGGVTAVAVLPTSLLAAAPAAAPVTTAPVGKPGAPTSLPGADAEANSNVLPGRTASAAAVRGGAAPDAAGEDRLAAEALEAGPAPVPQPRAETVAGEGDGTGLDVTAAPAAPAVTAGEPADPAIAAAERAISAAEAQAAAAQTAPRPAEAEAAEARPTEAEAAAADAVNAVDTAGTADAAGPAGGPTAATSATGDAATGATASAAGGAPAGAAAADGTGADRAGGDRHETAAEETATLRLPAQMSGEEAERRVVGEGEAADPYAIGPERHERAADEAEAEPVTDKGLPKRTPKVVSAPAPRPRTGGVDAEALRRRLGGFRQGSQAGRRDIEAELAAKNGKNAKNGEPGAQGAPGTRGDRDDEDADAPRPGQGTASEQAMGGTVEEASS
ncbi:sensor histidine kinase [Streptomyces abyssomicinicus]|uniref:sensor histidine kinase n=1 Tax=Streptomyces abyssomicinicus TaxID=574929 RepID=UPI001FEA307B|nr:nitrate- and nitrite sensing domain-containing protein [Streptomyces abyssomicinicus]